jgi:TRAP-type mannitol/chloroaromatic compound transport system substrate-binding protein
MKGVKMRIGGFAGQVMAKLGVVPQQIAGGDIYPALEKGTIDAAEWVGPYDDQKLGFNKVAQYYYYPAGGRARGAVALSSAKAGRAAQDLQGGDRAPRGETIRWSVAKYDAQNPKALRELVAGGTKFLPFPQPVMEACFNAANELYAETVGQEPEVQEGLRSVEAVPQRRGAVVPRRREHLRQLHGAPVGRQQALTAARSSERKAPLRRGFFFARSVAGWQADSAEWNQPANKKRPGRTTCNVASSCAPPVSAVARASASTLAAPAIAQSMPELKWRLASSFPKSLDTLYGAASLRQVHRRVDRQQVPGPHLRRGRDRAGLQVLDAVQNGTVEMGHSAGTYYIGKDRRSPSTRCCRSA